MKDILFTRQIHDADRAGRHFDVRLVDGDIAYSWATKKELPEPGKSIILWSQPNHDAKYALSDNIEIPKGQYGSGTTKLDFVRKARIEHSEDHFTMTTKEGEKYLFKHVPKFGEGAWLFKRLDMEKKASNKYLEKIAGFEKQALTRLIKEMIKRKAAGLPVSEAVFHELARRGASRSMLQYARGVKARDNKFMGHLGLTNKPSGPSSTTLNSIMDAAHKAGAIPKDLLPKGMSGNHLHRASGSYDAINRNIDFYRVPGKGLMRSHEVHEAEEVNRIGLQKAFDHTRNITSNEDLRDISKPRIFKKVEDLMNVKESPSEKRVKKNLSRSIDTHVKYPTPIGKGKGAIGNTGGNQHASWAVLGRESNDIRTNPFSKTLSGGYEEARIKGHEAKAIEEITGKRYGIDKFTNKNLDKLRRTK